MDERLDEVIQEIQDENANTVPAYKVFRSMLNQPNLIGVSSADGIQEAIIAGPLGQSSYYNFTCNLPRPALDVASVQLVSANIPQANANIPNTAAAFWYYRCSEYNAKIPNIYNLYYNRLLPSTYKQELIYTPTQYGWNRTFKSYKDLATELLKSGQTDLCWYNWENDTQGNSDGDYVPFIPKDVSITLNTEMNKFQMTGQNVYIPPTYILFVLENPYLIGDQVVYEGRSYVSLQSDNSGHEPSTSPLWWKRDYNAVMASWDESTNYGVGRYVTDGTRVYISTYPNATQNPNETYTWSATQTYSRYQVVFDPSNSTLYTYASDIPRVNNQPSSSGSSGWIATNWSSFVLYTKGFICFYGGIYYAALTTTQNHQPDTNPTRWTPIVFWTEVDMADKTRIWNRYLITGYNDPNVATAQGTEFESSWDSSYMYEQGEVVNYNGSAYQAVTQNIGTPPLDAWVATKTYDIGTQILYTGGASPKYYQSIQANNTNHTPSTSTTWWVPIRTEWKNTTTAPRSSGLYYLTSIYDMMGTDGTTEITFPPAIAGQPFNPNPSRLLNSVLGFTWNGIFTTSTLPTFSTSPTTIISDFQLLQDTNLLNRFRPIPFYQIRPNWSATIVYPRNYVVLSTIDNKAYYSKKPYNLNHEPSVSTEWWALEFPLALATPTIQNAASTTTVFTADAYANLVYSSIVYIYTSIVGGSTLDTKRNTNLLAITPMNAGNLGVAFSNQFVDNPLTKVFGDINAIYIELRDEFGEPYLMSNNAITSLTLKVKFIEEILPKDNT